MKDKIARICWNTEDWLKPSGLSGKCKNKKSYEYITGYGHEEWLLDLTKLIDGYHYAYLQAVGQHREKYIGECYNISIYSINDDTKQRWWIGTLNNVEIIDENESKKVFKIYKSNGWYEEMLEQLQAINADIDAFKNNIKPEGFAVVKFKPSDVKLLESPQEFAYKDPAVTSDYYNLKNKKLEPTLIYANDSFLFRSGHNEGKASKITAYEKHDTPVNLLHNKMQSAIYKELAKVHGQENVGTEVSAGMGNRIDLVIKHQENYSFYELKTDNSARRCVREGLGQLIEYANFNNDIRIEKFVIVSPNKPTLELEKYLLKIREKFNIPVYYQYFDVDILALSSDLI